MLFTVSINVITFFEQELKMRKLSDGDERKVKKRPLSGGDDSTN